MLRFFPLLLVLGACAPVQPASSAEEQLAGHVAGAPLGPAQSCITASPGQTLTVVGRQTLSYRRGDTVWINQMPRSCPGVRPFNTLLIETYGSRLCRGDHVRSLDRPGGVPGPVCVLGDFVPFPAR